MKQRCGHTCTVINSSYTLLIGGERHVDDSLDEIWLLDQSENMHMTWRKIDVSLIIIIYFYLFLVAIIIVSKHCFKKIII